MHIIRRLMCRLLGRHTMRLMPGSGRRTCSCCHRREKLIAKQGGKACGGGFEWVLDKERKEP